jgi:hypothetical protein
MAIRTLSLLLAGLLLAGCGGSTQTKKGEISRNPVKTSGSRPSWVQDDKSYWTDAGRMYFRVFSTGEKDLSFAVKGLDGDAYRTLVNAVKVRAGVEFDNAMRGSRFDAASIGEAREFVVNAIGEAKFSDLVKTNDYWEQFSLDEGTSVSYVYDVHALYSISEVEMAKARDDAWKVAEAQADRRPDQEAKKVLDAAKDRFMKGGQQ